MRFPPHMLTRLKRLTPRSLFGRALLIIVIPTVLVQIVSTYIFYERHWGSVQRNMGSALAGEIAVIVEDIRNFGYLPTKLVDSATYHMNLTTSLDRQKTQLAPPSPQAEQFDFLTQDLRLRLKEEFTVDQLPNGDIVVRVLMPAVGELSIVAAKKRLISPTTSIFSLWMTGTALILTLVAIAFLRNQIRPIVRLARAAESFGKGLDIVDFRPQGAEEVRKAASAFITMRQRVRRLILQRTDMLAAISHDLRTPLTRMKLQLAMLGSSREIAELQEDVAEMEKMIAEYLAFARGEEMEKAEHMRLAELCASLTENYARQGKKLETACQEDAVVQLRPLAFRRCLMNIIDNAFRFGSQVRLTVEQDELQAILTVDDNGPGIPQEERERVFRPFTRLEASRNPKTGGVGLGLTIARDIVLGHGGHIGLEDSPLGGLRVRITLPV